jgi:hypothetical protein
LLKKSFSDRSVVQNATKTPRNQGQKLRKWGFKPLNGTEKGHEGIFQHAGSFLIQHLAKRTSAYTERVAFSKLSGTLLGEALRSRGEVQEEEVRTLVVIVIIIVLIVVAYLLLSRRRR